jgi:hypothetical protein
MINDADKAANEANLPGLGYQLRKGKKSPSTKRNSVGG